MTKPSRVTRREFSVQAALLMLGGATITISQGCGGSSPSSPSPTATPTPAPTATPVADRAGTVSANHGHMATITAAQLNAGNALTLDIRGQGTHPHTVTLSAAEVTSIRNGARVTKSSTVNDNHDHDVTFN